MSETMTLEPYVPFYPESDGEPMGETDIHRDENNALIDRLAWHFRDEPDVYVSGDNFLYYEEGNPQAVLSPDVYVVRGVEKKQRRIYQLWVEKKVPCFALELSSKKTWLEDIGNKKALCAELGVDEYFLYDPEGIAVKPPLQGYRLRGGEYHRIKAARDGSLASRALGLRLSLDDERRMQLTDGATGARLLRSEEVRREHDAAEKERDTAEKERDTAEKERDAAEKERDAAEKERDAAEKERDAAEKERDALAARVAELERELAARHRK